MSSQDEEGGAGHGFGGGHAHFEPIPHDHDFCERVVINVSTPRPTIKTTILPRRILKHFFFLFKSIS